MRTARVATAGIGAILALTIGGCDSASLGTSSSSSTSTTQSATGVWSGTDSVTGDTIIGLVASSGEAVFIRSDGVQFSGTMQVAGSTAAATVNGYSNFYGSAFSDSSTTGLGTLNGTVTTESAMTLTLNFTTSGDTTLTGSWSLSYASVSSNTSSLSTISGNYSDSNTSAIVSISGNGSLYSQASNGCVLNGTVSVIDSSYNVYKVQYDLANCTGSSAALNGVSFSGLAVLNTGVSPRQIVVAVSGDSSSDSYGLASALTAT